MLRNPSTPVRSQVVVVGAGPVGLMAALRLRQQGISVRVLDQHSEPHAHCFPIVLHPQTTRLLVDVGISAPLFWRGRSVQRLAVYAGGERRALLSFAKIMSTGPGLVTVPQDVLRRALTEELRRKGVEIEWRSRLLALQQDPRLVWGQFEREDPSSTDGAKEERVAFEADYVIGADGYESTVRDAVGLRLISDGTAQTFAFFDATTPHAANEATLALTDDYGSSVYPMHGGRSRFSFQLGGGLSRAPDAAAFDELCRTRLPWLSGVSSSAWEWGGVAEFRRALVDRYGAGRVWLAGEAAHLTGPLGVQSLNVGIDEANELAVRIAATFRRSHQPSFGPHYDERRRWQWQKLLGHVPYAPFASHAWPQSRVAELIAGLPASGDDLDDLIDQLSLLERGSYERSVSSK